MKELANISVGRLAGVALLTAGLLLSSAAAQAQGLMVNGRNYTAAISVPNETDSWTFPATVGESIVMSAVEPGADTAFQPWILLYAPGSRPLIDPPLINAFGDVSAHINVVATATGTYTAVIASHDDAHSTGAYMVTLARVSGNDPFVVDPGDEGGPLISGANQPGSLTRGDQDMWTFTATAGENVSVSIGEVGDTNFAPWIRLFDPSGAFRTEGFSQRGGKVDITAPLTGTYTVVVADSYVTYAESGRYLLTMTKAPGTYVVPPNDEGGPMTNAVTYQGTIHRADLDQWTFMATAGHAVTITATEPGADSPFYPWIRVYGPIGTLSPTPQAFGATAAQVVVNIPVTGLYTVVMGSADTTYTAAGNYTLRADGIDAPPPLNLGDVVLDFGAVGLWLYSNDAGPSPSWQQLNTLGPTKMVRGDIDGTGTVSLVASFQGAGVWSWKSGAGWTQVHPYDAADLAVADLDGNGQDDIIISFAGGQGLWVRYNNISWVMLHPFATTALAVGNINGDPGRIYDLVITFPGYGVWAFVDNASWVQLHTLDALDIKTGDFDGNGQDDIVLDFQGYGVWIRANNSSWAQLNTLNSAGIAVGDLDGDAGRRKDIVISFPGQGVWVLLNGAAWKQIHTLNSPVLAVVDLDKNGKDDVVLDFPGRGVWVYQNNATYKQIHTFDAEGIVGGRFDLN